MKDRRAAAHILYGPDRPIHESDTLSTEPCVVALSSCGVTIRKFKDMERRCTDKSPPGQVYMNGINCNNVLKHHPSHFTVPRSYTKPIFVFGGDSMFDQRL